MDAPGLELSHLRRTERETQACTEVFDVVAVFLIGKPLDDATFRKAVALAQERFRDDPVFEASPYAIVRLVEHQFQIEGDRRRTYSRCMARSSRMLR